MLEYLILWQHGMYDLFFISYEEPNADDNWNKLKSKFDHAKRIHGIKGISNAHLACAKTSFTKMFWTVDGDTIVNDDWDFSYQPPKWDQQYLHLWYSQNPVNGLEYGYGSVKLWPKKQVIDYNGVWLDFTTSVGDIKVVEKVVATTCFNTGPYETWKSSFREGIKLCENLRKDPTDMISKARLLIWETALYKGEFFEWSIKGTRDAIQFFNEGSDLHLINDFDWLKQFFVDKCYNV